MKQIVHKGKSHSILIVTFLLLPFLVAVKAQNTSQWPGFGSGLKYDSGGTDPWAVASGDFNRDGIPDIAVGYGNQQKIGVLLGNGDGTFQAATNYSISFLSRAITTGDLNGDGKIDLILASYSPPFIVVILGNGDGTFQPAASYPIVGFPSVVIVGDFNKDSRLDIAVSINDLLETPNVNEDGISVLLNKGDGTFLPATHYSVNTVGLTLGDFNGDGKLDLATGNGLDSTVSVLLGNGDGGFGGALHSPGPSAPALAIGAGDFNRDGKLDLAVANTGSPGGVTILIGKGDGAFQIGTSYTGVNAVQAGAIADFNGDGKADIVLTDTASGSPLGGLTVVLGSVHVLLGNGDGTFQSPVSFNVGVSPFSLAVGDFNGDHAPDLVVGHNTSSTYISGLLNSVINREPCQKPGPTTVLTDSTGDTRYGISSHDIQSVSISEKTSASGEPLLVITLKVADLNVITPTTVWQVTFSGPFGGGGAFELRSGEHSELSTTNGLDPESGFSQDGSIRFVVSKRKLDLVAGETITNIKARVYRWGGEVNDYDDWAPDDFNAQSSATYTLGGNNSCVPVLLTQSGSNRAVALDSVTFVRDPFSFTSTTNFSSDQRTRVVLLAINVDLQPGEDASAVTVHAEDSLHEIFSLPVEYVGWVPKFSGLTQVNVRLPDDLANGGDYLVRVAYHGLESNQALITIKSQGSSRN